MELFKSLHSFQVIMEHLDHAKESAVNELIRWNQDRPLGFVAVPVVKPNGALNMVGPALILALWLS